MKSSLVEPLSPDIEALLASERNVAPQPEDLRRRALLRARAALSTSPMTARAPRARRASWRWRWAVATAGVLVAGTLATAAIRVSLRAKQPAAEPSLVEAVREPRPLVARLTAPAPALDDWAPTPIAPPPRLAARPLTRSEGYTLELELLQPARAALARADFASALAAIATHDRRFPNGQLAEEREALRVLALSGAHQSEDARRAATAFRKRFPRSLLLTRMNDALGGAP
jgi:hypothetical protein